MPWSKMPKKARRSKLFFLMSLLAARQKLQELSSPQKSKILKKFFKTGPGEYAEDDIFLGIQVPQTRRVAKQFQDLPLKGILKLLKSPIHEERLCALFILLLQYQAGDENKKQKIYQTYLSNLKHVNNWDLVDLTADKIVGDFLFNKDKKNLYQLAQSKNIWERRIAIIATFYFIRNKKFGETFGIAQLLLSDREDLIHKAVGWMLREVGKRNRSAEENFLKKHCQTMPRTMLRYAIERFPEKKRLVYLKK